MPKLIPPVVEPGSLAGAEQPTIPVDDELVLRPFRRDDWRAVVTAFSTPDIQHYHFRRMDGPDEAQRWIEDGVEGWRVERTATWAIAETATDEVIGRVTLHDLALVDGLAEVSYWVLAPARGRGVATRACVAATQWAHGIGLHRVQLQHSARNERSRRVAVGAGFTVEGVRRGANLHEDGWHDMVLYSHLATDPW
jgi:RimJ/RimL family protein N-acetyltransferase